MGSWGAPLMDDMEFEIPHPVRDIVQDSSSAWDQHVMEVDYDVRFSESRFLVLARLLLAGLSSPLSSLGH